MQNSAASVVVDCCFVVQLCPAIECCIRAPQEKLTGAVAPWAIVKVSCFMFYVPKLTGLIVIAFSPSTDFESLIDCCITLPPSTDLTATTGAQSWNMAACADAAMHFTKR